MSKGDFLETMFRTFDEKQLREAYDNLVGLIPVVCRDMPQEYLARLKRNNESRDFMHFIMILALLWVPGFRDYCYGATDYPTRLDSFLEYAREQVRVFLQGQTKTEEETIPIYSTWQHFVWCARYEYLLRVPYEALLVNYKAQPLQFTRPTPINPPQQLLRATSVPVPLHVRRHMLESELTTAS